MIVHPIGMMRADAASSSIADQIIAELGSDLVVLYDMTDFTKMFQNTAGTTAVTAAGQEVRHLVDLSGNGHHATASAISSPGNCISGASFVNINSAGLKVTGTLTGATTTMEIYLHLNRGSATVWDMIGKEGSSAHAAGIAWTANSSATYAGFTGTITDYVDNTIVSSATRATLYTAIAAVGGYCTQSLRGIDLTSHVELMPMAYQTSAIRLNADAKFYLITKALTSTQRTNLHTILDAA